MVCKRCWVSGRVQGVWYRASTRDRAVQLGISGHAQNLADGRVEVLACGDSEAVSALAEWLWQGSPASSVTAVECSEVEAEPLPSVFSTG